MKRLSKSNGSRLVVAATGVILLGLVPVEGLAQTIELPRRLRERISRTLVDEGFPAPASAFDTEVKITASDGAEWDWFGHSVAISGDTVIVGGFGDDDNGFNSGSAYLYQRDEGGPDNWGQVTNSTAQSKLKRSGGVDR